MDFGRMITAMVTPFDASGQIDVAQTKALVDFLIDEQQSDGLVVCGTTGESPALSDDEKLQMFELVVEHAAGRCKVIAGTGSNNTAHTVHLTKEAGRLGVDGILLVAPYYNRPSQEGLYQHFWTVAEQSELPIMLYNVPKRTGSNINADTTLRLAQHENIVATKEASGDLEQATSIIRQAPDGFAVYTGEDDLILPMLAVGGYGVVSVISHIAGSRIQQMISAYLGGHVQEAAKLHGQLSPVAKGMFICSNPVPVKYALNQIGMNVGGVRLPLVEANDSEKAHIRELL